MMRLGIGFDMNEYIKLSNVGALLRNAKGGWGVSTKRVYQLVKLGRLETVNIDGVNFVKRDAILNYRKPRLGRPCKQITTIE